MLVGICSLQYPARRIHPNCFHCLLPVACYLLPLA